MPVADKIKTLRVKNGLTQAQLADLIHVTRQAEAKWESGTSSPDIYKIKDLAKILGVSSDDLLSEEPLQDGAHLSNGSPDELRDCLKVKFLDVEFEEVRDFFHTLGYFESQPREGEGQLLILHPVSLFSKNRPIQFITLTFGLPPKEWANKDKESLRKELQIGLPFAKAYSSALASKNKVEGSRHLARGITYVVFAALDLVAFIIYMWMGFILSYFYFIPTPLIAVLFVFLLVKGIKWIKPANFDRYPEEKKIYETSLAELERLSEVNRALYEKDQALNAKTTTANPAKEGGDALSAIKEAKNLLEQGVITQEEFVALKKKIIDKEK
jgi:transcriptional regulator with XRE-family HTH domain